MQAGVSRWMNCHGGEVGGGRRLPDVPGSDRPADGGGRHEAGVSRDAAADPAGAHALGGKARIASFSDGKGSFPRIAARRRHGLSRQDVLDMFELPKKELTMAEAGGCHCGAVRYEVKGAPQHVMLCHCQDCRKSSGAPLVAWAAFAEAEFRLVEGEPVAFNSSGQAWRHFCARCGTGLYYRNAQMLPGIVDIQAVTLDNPAAFPADAHIQVAEQIGWMTTAHELPGFQRFPG